MQAFIEELIYHLEKGPSNLHAIVDNMNIITERLKLNLKFKSGSLQEKLNNQQINGLAGGKNLNT